MASHLLSKVLITAEMSALARLRRISGAMEAAKAIAPQARTEKTVEKRIVQTAKRQRTGAGDSKGVECRAGELRLGISTQKPGQAFIHCPFPQEDTAWSFWSQGVLEVEPSRVVSAANRDGNIQVIHEHGAALGMLTASKRTLWPHIIRTRPWMTLIRATSQTDSPHGERVANFDLWLEPQAALVPRIRDDVHRTSTPPDGHR